MLLVGGFHCIENNVCLCVIFFVKGKVDQENILVIWRSLIGLDFEQDKKFIKKHLNDDNYSYVYINGKNLIKNSKSIEVELKKLTWE